MIDTRIIRKAIHRKFEKSSNEVIGLFLRKYPPFIWSDSNPHIIPAFVFHQVSTDSLQEQLEYLAENGYTTLTADEYVHRNACRSDDGKREVLLTLK